MPRNINNTHTIRTSPENSSMIRIFPRICRSKALLSLFPHSPFPLLRSTSPFPFPIPLSPSSFPFFFPLPPSPSSFPFPFPHVTMWLAYSAILLIYLPASMTSRCLCGVCDACPA